MSATYIPRADSLADKVCRYFMRLPDEELLTREIAANFDVEVKNVANNLRLAVEASYLTVDGTVYSAGKNIAGFIQALSNGVQQAGDSVAGTPPPAPSERPRKSPSKAFRMDISVVAIDKGIPMPAGKTPSMDWTPLLDKLGVGDSFLLPLEARSAIGSAATKFKQSTGRVLSIRSVPDGVRVWRTS